MRYLILLLALFLFSCEDIVTLESPVSDRFLVVESTLTNLPGSQKITLTRSQDFFDNGPTPAIRAAEVVVKDDAANEYRFIESAQTPGLYVWAPADSTRRLGQVGRTYQLTVKAGSDTFVASAKMNPVPPIDSIAYKKATANPGQSGEGKPKEGFEARFFGIDLKGEGDCYRVKFYKNGKLFNAPSDLLVFYDAALQKITGTDGFMFNLPIRRAINPELYVANDKLKLELYSISLDQFSFYSQARLELNNAGLFARPAANIPTNLVNTNKNSKLQGSGWFGVSAVSTLETIIDPAKARKDLP